jgi:hypothetical protein
MDKMHICIVLHISQVSFNRFEKKLGQCTLEMMEKIIMRSLAAKVSKIKLLFISVLSKSEKKKKFVP